MTRKIHRGHLGGALVAAIGVLALAGFQPTAMAQEAGTKLASGAVVPNFNGVWERGEGIAFDPKGSKAPFTPAFQAKYDAAMAERPVLARVRSTRPPSPATLRLGDNGEVVVAFTAPEEAVSPGQACVLYAAAAPSRT